MAKQLIRLTESDLHRIIKETIDSLADKAMNSSSWLNGKYTLSNGYTVEINSSLPYIAVDDADGENMFYAQEHEADDVLDELMQMWNSNDEWTQQQVIEHWVSLYL